MEAPSSASLVANVGLRRTRLCEHWLGLKWPPCRFGAGQSGSESHGCHFAHTLSELQVPDESATLKWSEVWAKGEVDIVFWEKGYQTDRSKHRFLTAFFYEKKNSPDSIPNWAWGLAWHLGLVNKSNFPKRVPRDFEWPRMWEAWAYGISGDKPNTRTRAMVRNVIDHPKYLEEDENLLETEEKQEQDKDSPKMEENQEQDKDLPKTKDMKEQDKDLPKTKDQKEARRIPSPPQRPCPIVEDEDVPPPPPKAPFPDNLEPPPPPPSKAPIPENQTLPPPPPPKEPFPKIHYSPPPPPPTSS